VKKINNATGYYGFETITLCPVDRHLIERSLLSAEELSWLNKYHQAIFDTLSGYLADDEAKWLKSATAPIK
jgi:Xaa-Pro aminopeptidase